MYSYRSTLYIDLNMLNEYGGANSTKKLTKFFSSFTIKELIILIHIYMPYLYCNFESTYEALSLQIYVLYMKPQTTRTHILIHISWKELSCFRNMIKNHEK